ncbi:ATP-binding cassette, subfamily B [Hathewaya proteolytica DSM 3090]|uniref:ATP-binding cassette, subfamily B n=1 Tax=Hathewaya proteolytica DSM 3090 TaxID=1121331 RepID=A0A1M6KKX2_9CLOT|nr:ABC transporter ATP-binding protein [Hathewaya proteolytica]SHJ59632.1 ATP-binding cassette, subfamily B [Hathewaya proteolytica DSM 3090]
MKKKYSSYVIISRICGQIFKNTPVAAIASPVYYILEGLFPAFTAIIMAKLFNYIYEYSLGTRSISFAIKMCVILIIGYVVRLIFQLISSVYINADLYEKNDSEFNRKIYEKAAKLSLVDYENSKTMEREERAKQCVNNEFMSQIFMSGSIIITSLIGILSIITVLASYSLWFIPVSIFSVLPYVVAKIIRGNEFYCLKYQQSENVRKRDYLWQLLTNKSSIKEMRVTDSGQYLKDKWLCIRNQINEELWQQSRKDSMSLMLCDFIRITGYFVCIVLALVMVVNGTINVGIFGACISVFLQMQEQTKKFLINMGGFNEKVNFASDYFEFIDLEEEEYGEIKFDKLKYNIIVENVSFSYPNSKKSTIDNINLEIKKGEKVVILGENGSGKTTLTKLILGFYKPESGEVKYDGISVLDFKRGSFIHKISGIAQNFTKYNLSIRENVALCERKFEDSDENIWRALNYAGLDMFKQEKVSLDEKLGRDFGGRELSGGQWQKLAIARGIYKDSEIIIMDEPTSALDPVMESEILKKFMDISEGKTAIIVSHRVGLSTLADKIVVMKQGKISEIGCHEELMKRQGEYYKLYKAQQQWYV